MKRAQLHNTFLVAAILAATSVGAQQPLNLDGSFVVPLNSQVVEAALPNDDGTLILSGTLVFVGQDPFTPRSGARVSAVGVVDGLFVEYPEMGQRITRWNDQFYCASTQTVRRLNMDGSVDQSFTHMNQCPLFGSLQGGDYHVFPDGRVLLVGTHSLYDTVRGYVGLYNLIWFTNTGYLDTTRVHRQGNGSITRVKEQQDGRFLCSGTGDQYDDQAVSVVFRVEADGSLDPSFSTSMTGLGNYRWVHDMEPLEDGRALIGGFWGLTGTPDTIGVVRVLADGSLDPTFDPVPIGDTYNESPWYFPEVYDILPLPDGRMIITGDFDRVRGVPRGGIAMLNADGSLNTEYFDGAACGPYLPSTGPPARRWILGIVPAPDGSYYIHGAYRGYNDGTTNYPQQGFVSRLYGLDVGVREEATQPLQVQPNPTHGPLTVQLPSGARAWRAEVLDANGRVVYAAPETTQAQRLALDLGELGQGAYVLRLHLSQGAPRNGRFVIMK